MVDRVDDSTIPRSRDHHVGSPATSFQNPWPSEGPVPKMTSVFHARFIDREGQNFVPVPEKEELVAVRKPTWGYDVPNSDKKLKATWLGHAGWLIETSRRPEAPEVAKSGANDTTPPSRGVTVLLDPFLGERTSPLSFFGPKRYNPAPCSVSDLPPIDIVCISHNHYDHLDLFTVNELKKHSPQTRYLCPQGNRAWFISVGCNPDLVTEYDWWDESFITIKGIGIVKITCTPAQHGSARTPFDKNKTLWSSWVICETPDDSDGVLDGRQNVQLCQHLGIRQVPEHDVDKTQTRRVFFAGDTGYRYVSSANPSREEEASNPRCPAFKEIGEIFGPFDLALLPIGLCAPRHLTSGIHCSPEDSLCVHFDVKSKRSFGMHYGTIRGGLSSVYEDVRDPPRRWKVACEAAGLKFGKEPDAAAGLCDIGETILID